MTGVVNKSQRVSEILGPGKKIRMRPQRIAGIVAALGTCCREDGMRFPEQSRSKFHTHQRSKRSLSRTARSTTPTHCFHQGRKRWKSIGACLLDNIIDPALDACQERFEACNGGFLFGGVLGGEQTAGKYLLQGSGIGEVNITHGIVEALCINLHVARVLLDGTDNARR